MELPQGKGVYGLTRHTMVGPITAYKSPMSITIEQN